jgi:hypothetical protein
LQPRRVLDFHQRLAGCGEVANISPLPGDHSVKRGLDFHVTKEGTSFSNGSSGRQVASLGGFVIGASGGLLFVQCGQALPLALSLLQIGLGLLEARFDFGRIQAGDELSALIRCPSTTGISRTRPLVLASRVARSRARTVPTTSSLAGDFRDSTVWIFASTAGRSDVPVVCC